MPASSPPQEAAAPPSAGYGAAFAGDAALERQLQADSCVLTAEAVLEKKVNAMQGGAPVIARIGAVAK